MGTTAFKTTTDSSHSPNGFFAERKAHFFRGPADSFKGFPTRFYGRDEPWSASRRMLPVFAFSHFTLHLDFILSGQVFLPTSPTDQAVKNIDIENQFPLGHAIGWPIALLACHQLDFGNPESG